MTPEISIVIPAFNEALRLPATLDRVQHYLSTVGLTAEVFVLGGVHDTQCGFKAFTAEAADRVFPVLQTRGFGFDVEVLYRAQHAGYQIVEVPTRWINSPQSRVHPIRHSAAMFLELLAIPDRVRRHPTPAAKTDQRRASA